MINCINILNTPYQPRVVYDSISNRTQQLFWDANGNMDQIYDCKYETTRFHQWDDVNRLRMVLGPSKGGFYGYDANGERVYKLIGDYNVVSTGYLNIGASFNIDDAVVYPNSFLTITPRGYTKHYFAGSERVATALGDGQWIEDVPISAIETTHDYNIIKKTFEPLFSSFPLGYPNYEDIDINLDINGINQSPIQYCTNPYALKVLSLSCSYGLLYQTMSHYTEHQGGSEKIFYYHGDHLGSASWITDSHCAPIQYIHYLPYGEILANQYPYFVDERFKFTGKEYDYESGYYYFGARYLLSELGNFISSDPLSDKYPEIQSYLYCNGNPVMNIDPTGRKIKGISEEDTKSFIDDVNYILKDNRYAKFRELLKTSSGNIINTISTEALTESLQDINMSKEEEIFIKLLFNAINSPKIYKVEYVQTKISNIGKNYIESFFPYDIQSGVYFLNNQGGGTTLRTGRGSYSAILDIGNSGIEQKRSIVAMHEVLGHGLSIGHKLSKRENNANGIRVEQLIRNMLGMPPMDPTTHTGPYNNPFILPRY